MALVNKPDESIFASSAKQGEVDNFPDLLRGWGITFDQTQGIPPMEWFNFLFKRLDEKHTYLMQRGLPEWSDTQDYTKGSCVQFEGLSYRALKNSKNNHPNESNSQYWVRWGFTLTEIALATLTQYGLTQLYTGYDSQREDLALTPKTAYQLKQLIDSNTRSLGNVIPNSKKSSAVNSNSADTVATSAAVKTAYDKGVDAKTAADNANNNANGRVSKSGDAMTGSLTIARASKFYKVGSYNWGKFIELSGDAVIGNDKCVIGFNNNGALHLGGKPNAAEFNASIDESMLWVRGDVQTKTGKSLNKSVSIDDFTTIKAENGWTKLPTGLIIQWGQFLPSNLINNETGSTTFPQRYPNSVFCVICGSVGGSSGGGTEGFAVISQDNSKFSWRSYWEGRHKRDFPEKIQWIAIGY
nr:MAG TPA: Baseplate structural protein [Caudoviricetes sp.]